MLLEAAANGVKFGTVVLIVPAVDNDALSVGGKYENALQNIERLVVVYSRRQKAVFYPYAIAIFDRALGDVGPEGPIAHPNYLAIDATNPESNTKYGIHVVGHGDIYDDEMIQMMIENFRSPMR